MDILKALIALMCYCAERDDCIDCPFDVDGACVLSKIPSDYDINLIAKAISKINKEMLESD